jgi:hypothetical protein
MALDAAFTRDDGSRNVAGVDTDWSDWVAASRTLHYCADDPLLDWLDAYGEANGFVPDDKRTGYDPRTDFRTFIFQRANEFEAAVMRHLSSNFQTITICQERGDTRNRVRVEETWSALASGVEIVAQGVLWNPETNTYGAPDLLVRSDVLHRLFPDCMSEEHARQAARDLPLRDVHYRVVDVKFTTLDLLKDGHAGADHLKHMVQIWLYNDALGRMQGYTPPAGFLLGRRWEDSKGRGKSALERLARIDRDHHIKRRDVELSALALGACDWIRRVRSQGANWRVLPDPSVEELRPNMRQSQDQPWHHAKGEIARELEDLTLVPRVTPEKRAVSLSSGLCRWTDPRCCAADLGITGEKMIPLVDAVIAANHSDKSGPFVFPDRVKANEALWRHPCLPEFYVDFETVSDLDEDFASFPEAGGQPLIFMVGCGHVTGPADAPVWNHRVFTVDRLTLADERRIIDEWFSHMAAVCAELGTSLEDARVFHWSPAEESSLTGAYNAAHARHGLPPWPTVPWVDLLNRVVKEQPVTVRGAFGFGLKAIAKALHSHGFIETLWHDGSTDGLGAMVGAWSCNREAQVAGGSMRAVDLMREIEAYNEVDCKVMAEALG